jgi:hypothetical protein
MTFSFRGGRRAENLEDFLLVLHDLPEDEFRGYIERDDFASWIRGSLGMNELAARISGLESRQTIIEHVRHEVEHSRLPAEPLLSAEAIREGLASKEPTNIIPVHERRNHTQKEFVAGMLLGIIVGIVAGVLLIWL